MIELDKIYNEDCLVGMERIPDGSVDCVICDMPYGTTILGWDSVIPLDKLWAQYKRVCKPNAAVILFGKQPFTSRLVLSNLEWYKYEIVWEKSRPANFLQLKRRPAAVHENIEVFYKEQPTYNEEMFRVSERFRDKGGNKSQIKIKTEHLSSSKLVRMRKPDDGWRHPQDVVQFESAWEEGMHPTQKPVPLLRYLVRTYTNSGDVVLDNCAGSGSTCVACVQEGRHFIGFETDERYHAKAVEWVGREARQLRLF